MGTGVAFTMSTRPLDPDHPYVKEQVEPCDIAWTSSETLIGFRVCWSLYWLRGLSSHCATGAHSTLEVQCDALWSYYPPVILQSFDLQARSVRLHCDNTEGTRKGVTVIVAIAVVIFTTNMIRYPLSINAIRCMMASWKRRLL